MSVFAENLTCTSRKQAPSAPIWPLIPQAVTEAVHDALLRSNLDRTVLNGLQGVGAIEEFEATFGASLQVPHVVAVSSGAAALHLALIAAGVGPGDEVILSSYGWGQVLVFIDALDAVPVFADIDPETLCVSPVSVAERISDRTRAIIVTHHAGYPADVPAISDMAGDAGVTVIEDCAQALGASLRGHAVGTMGDIGVFSFGPRKHLPLGEGGALITHDQHLCDLAVRAGQHPDRAALRVADPRAFRWADEWFWPYRMHPLAAIMGNAMIPFVPIWHQERLRNIEELVSMLRGDREVYPHCLKEDGEHAWGHLALSFRLREEDGPSRHEYAACVSGSGLAVSAGPVRVPLNARPSVTARWGEQPCCPVAEERCANDELFLADSLGWVGDQTEGVKAAAAALAQYPMASRTSEARTCV